MSSKSARVVETLLAVLTTLPQEDPAELDTPIVETSSLPQPSMPPFLVSLVLLRWRQAQRMVWATWALLLLMMHASVGDTFPERQRAGDGRPLDDLSPSLPVLLARAILTAAPPVRVPFHAGTTG